MGSTEVTNQSINLDPVWSVYVVVDALGSELDMRVLLFAGLWCIREYALMNGAKESITVVVLQDAFFKRGVKIGAPFEAVFRGGVRCC